MSVDEMADNEGDELLKRLWKMPPKPHAKIKPKAKRKKSTKARRKA